MIHIEEAVSNIKFASPMYFDRTEKVRRSIEELNLEEMRDLVKYLFIGFETVHGNIEKAREFIVKADDETSELLGWSEELEIEIAR